MEISSPAADRSRRHLRDELATLHLGDVEVQNSSTPSHATVRFQTPGADPNAVDQSASRRRSRQLVPNVRVRARRVVGPKVSEELFAGGLIALGLAIVLMLIYIWFRFELQFGLGAVFALFHDIILTLGIILGVRIEFT